MKTNRWKVAGIVSSVALSMALVATRAASVATAHADPSYMESARMHVMSAVDELRGAGAPDRDPHLQRAIDDCNAAVTEIDKGISDTPALPGAGP